MLIYLDANIVQYCADYEGFIFGDEALPLTIAAKLRRELIALRQLVELELEIEQRDFENRWDFAAPAHLMKELFSGKPSESQRYTYLLLRETWDELGRQKYTETDEERISLVERSLRPLKLRHAADRWHLAEAIALGASWFLTNDNDIINKTLPQPAQYRGKIVGIKRRVGIVQGIRVARPSECIKRLSLDPVFGLSINDF
jgi:hypothetical protein